MDDVLTEIDRLDERHSERQVRRAPALASAMPPRTATEPSLDLGRRRVCFRNAQTFMAGAIARELRGGMRKSTAFHNSHSPIRHKQPNSLSPPSLAVPSLSCAFIAAIFALTISKSLTQ